MYKLTFTLKQHTPIIHFQHEQEGATLRASEVKPKLDKFLIERLQLTQVIQKDNKPVEVPKQQFAKWFNNSEHLSLNYKLRFAENNSQKIPIENFHKNAPMYFGNMGDDAIPKHFKLIDLTNVSIISFNSDFLDSIRIILYEFFFGQNFGTRQSKGYGSFEVVSINGDENIVKKQVCDFSFSIEASGWFEVLTKVNLFYRSLRSGINEVASINYTSPFNNTIAHKQQITSSKFYFKPLIFIYAKHLQRQWDKKTIKQYFLNSDYVYRKLIFKEKQKPNINWAIGDAEKMEELSLKKHIITHNSSDILTYSELNNDNHFFLDYKDLFGLSNLEAWKSYGKTIVKKNATNLSQPKTFSEKNKKDPDYVERFKSPLTFKILKTNQNQYTVYVIIDEPSDIYKGQKFIIYDRVGCTSSNLCLKIPEDFSFSNFFKFIRAKENFDIEKHVENKFKNTPDGKPYFQTLKTIYNQIQTNPL